MNIKLLLTGILFIGSTLYAQEKRILTLEECREMALTNNVDIQTGKLDIDAARQTQKEAFTKYFPSISAGAATYKADDDLIKGTIPPHTTLGHGNTNRDRNDERR